MGLRTLFGLNKKEGTSSMSDATTDTKDKNQPDAAKSESSKKITAEVKTLDVAADSQDPTSKPLRPEMKPHAFVIMPFGKKKGGDGSLYDFNAIYLKLIKPTLEMAGFEPFRADEETTSGDILTDMFQELLLADLCLVDMSIDNANVFYELGIRHAFRKRGIVHIQAGRAYMPFDVFNVRTIPYHITDAGVPDPDTLEKDKAAIARVTRDTWASEKEAIHSPIFNILTGLKEPDPASLRTPLATGFWREYNEWNERVTVAQRQKRIGDILLLTEEIKNPLIKEEAISQAGSALRSMDQYELALEQYRRGLEVNSENLTFRREEALNLNRVGKVDEAIVKIENILNEHPTDGESISILGRIYKEMWRGSWQWIKDKNTRLKTAYDSYHWLLRAIDVYMRGYRANLNEIYPGINALTLSIILVTLAKKYGDPKSPDPEIKQVKDNLEDLRSSMIVSLESNLIANSNDYWTLVSMAELLVMTGKDAREVVRAYRKALTASRSNTFYLNSSLGQLEMLKSLDQRTKFVDLGINIIQEELLRMARGDEEEHKRSLKSAKRRRKPRRDGYVFLFTGYMVSHSGKKENHFPPALEGDIRSAIQATLKKHNAGPNDVAVTTGMDAGSEIIFIESCVEREIPVQAYFPYAETAYIRDFVSPGGDEWVDRFYKLRNHPLVDEFYQPDHVGPPREGDNVYERNNRWALYSSLIKGIDKVRLIALWDGKNEMSGDLDVRLIKHMVDLMRDTGGIVEQINPAKLPHDTITGNKKPRRQSTSSKSKKAPRKLSRIKKRKSE